MENDYKHLRVKPKVHKKVKMAAAKEGKNISDLIDEYFREYDKLLVEE